MFICQVLQGESMQQDEELMHLRSQVEFQKMQAAVIAQIEGESAALERERETLRGTVDSLRAAVRKVRRVICSAFCCTTRYGLHDRGNIEINGAYMKIML